MALQNQGSLSGNFENSMVEYKSNDETVKLSPGIVKKYLTSGNGAVSDQEVAFFINMCKAQKLNPFLHEVYLIKYGSSPASIVTGKEVFTKRANRTEKYRGQQAGVVVLKKDGTLENRIGGIVLKEETLVGGWAKIYIAGHDFPLEHSVSFDEYAGRKSDGTLNNQWSTKPATMIRKVALVQALREAFPEEFQGMYSAEEMGVVEPAAEPIKQPEIEVEPPKKQEKLQSKGKVVTVEVDEQVPLPFDEPPLNMEDGEEEPF